jgi:hypothetical protein
MNIKSSILKTFALILPYALFLIAGSGFAIAYLLVGPTYAIKSLVYVIPIILAAIISLCKIQESCPNCGQQTLRTKDWVCQWCGYPLLSKAYKRIDKKYNKLQEEKRLCVSPSNSDSEGEREPEMGSAPVSHVYRISFIHLFLVTIFLFIISIMILISFPTRPWAYFVIVSFISGSILAQILWKRHIRTDYLIIFEIILLSLDLIWGVSIKYPLYFGDTDILNHLNYINSIVQTGHITEIGTDYQNFPLFHIFNSIGAEFTGLSLKNSLFVFSGISWQVGILFAYLIFKKFSNSRIFSLIACLLLATSQQIIFLGMYAVTRSLGYVFVLCWFYLILGDFDFKRIFLSLVTLSALILTHHTTVLFFIPIIVLAYITQKLFTPNKIGRSRIQLLFLELLIVVFFSYLLYIANSIMGSFARDWFKQIYSADTVTNIISSRTGQSLDINAIFFSFVVFFSLIGIVSALKFHNTFNKHHNIVGIALISLLFLLVYCPGPLDMLPQSQISLLYRFSLLVSPFVIYMVAYGVNHFIFFEQTLSRHIFGSGISKPFFTMGIVVIMTFFSTICGVNGNDNTYLLKTFNHGTQYFSNSELATFSFVINKCNTHMTLYGDYETIRNEYYFKDFNSKQIIKDADLSYINQGYLILRSGEIQKSGGLTFSHSGYNGIPGIVYRYNPEQSNIDIMRELSNYSCFYSDGDVRVYIINKTGKPNLSS